MQRTVCGGGYEVMAYSYSTLRVEIKTPNLFLSPMTEAVGQFACNNIARPLAVHIQGKAVRWEQQYQERNLPLIFAIYKRHEKEELMLWGYIGLKKCKKWCGKKAKAKLELFGDTSTKSEAEHHLTIEAGKAVAVHYFKWMKTHKKIEENSLVAKSKHFELSLGEIGMQMVDFHDNFFCYENEQKGDV